MSDPSTALREHYERYDPELVRELPATVRRRYSDVLRRLDALSPGRRLLEMGCGNGHFLEMARECGWEVAGTELSRPHVERARDRGLDVAYADLLSEDPWPGRTFDAVVLIEVLEHVPDPLELLRAAGSRLVADGAVYLTTPNFGSITRRVLGASWTVLDPEHVVLATPRGLGEALRRSGYEVLELRSKNLDPGEYRRALGGRRPVPGDGASRARAAGELRDRIEASRGLRAAKAAANFVLGLGGLGETLECLAVHREART